jgi:uncharacterized protein
MRAPQDVPSAAARIRGRRMRVALLVVLILVALVVVLEVLATIYTDSLWFSSISLHNVWSTLLGVKVGLFASFGAVFFVLIWVNLAICDRTSARNPAPAADDEVVRRYQRVVRPHAGRLHLAVSLVLALIGGAVSVGQWNNWLLFIHAQSFPTKDPQFGLNDGFFVFRLPFLQFLLDWTLGVLVVTVVVTVAFHYLNGGIRTQHNGPRVAPQVKVHLSVLLALVAIAKAAGYFLQRYTLDMSTNGYVEGAGYTDVHARLPAMEILFVISLASAAILLYNVRLQGWRLPVVAFGLWAFVALVIGVIYPAALQWLHVGPAQSTLERPYITRNIKATRAAYGLDNIKVTSHYPDHTTSVSSSALNSDLTSLENIRLWDPTQVISGTIFNKQQDAAGYYDIPSVAIDRYTVDNKLRPVAVGVRQVDATDLPSSGWLNTHLQFTHGNGVVLAQANEEGSSGSPIYKVSTVPSKSASGYPTVKQPSVYFGETLPGYVVADTKQGEVDHQNSSGKTVESHYKGTGGVPVGSFLNRAAFALRLGDFNLLLSSLLTPESKIMFVRDVRTMAEKAAPFLSFDSQPSAAVVNGQIYWIMAGYTTTNDYPYSENVDNVDVPSGSGLPARYNYVRNSVEVVVNAYTGAMTFYDIDSKDPILQAYRAAFPNMFKSETQMPSGIRSHLRYGQDLFAAQAAVYGRYHITSAAQFYSAADAWLVTPTLGVSKPNQQLNQKFTVNAQGQVVSGTYEPMTPLYQVLAEPGAGDVQSFTVTDAYVPGGAGPTKTPILRAFLMGSSDPMTFGQLHVYETASGKSHVGPVQADAEISSNKAVSDTITLLNQQDSSVYLGDTLIVPVATSVIYVRPLYVESKSVAQPLLTDVIGVLGHKVVMRTTLDTMLDTLLGTHLAATAPAVSTTTVTTGPTKTKRVSTSTSAQDVQMAQTDLATAAQDFTKADAALKTGKLGTYQTFVQQAETLTSKAQQLLGSAKGTAGSGPSGSGAAAGTPPTSGATSTTTATPTTAPVTTPTAASGET